MAKITYENKVALNVNSDIADVNKCNATDLNEIKNVVNENDDNTTTNTNNIANNTANIGTLSNLNTTSKNNLVSAINEVNANANNLKPVQLYSYTGTNKQTSITLSDSYSNYKFIEIYGQRNVMHGFIKMNTTDSNVIDFNIVGQNNGYLEISSSHMTFNNTSVKLTGNVITFDTTIGTVAGYDYNQQNIIRKIYGYK